MNIASAAQAKHSSMLSPQEWICMSAVWSLYSYWHLPGTHRTTLTSGAKEGTPVSGAQSGSGDPSRFGTAATAAPAESCASAAGATPSRRRLRFGGRCGSGTWFMVPRGDARTRPSCGNVCGCPRDCFVRVALGT